MPKLAGRGRGRGGSLHGPHSMAQPQNSGKFLYFCSRDTDLPDMTALPRKMVTHKKASPAASLGPRLLHISSFSPWCVSLARWSLVPVSLTAGTSQGKDVLSVLCPSFTGPHGALYTLPQSPRPAPVGFPGPLLMREQWHAFLIGLEVTFQEAR